MEVQPESNQVGFFWEIIRSAVHLLTSADLKLVRQCAADDCDWLFIDKGQKTADGAK